MSPVGIGHADWPPACVATAKAVTFLVLEYTGSSESPANAPIACSSHICTPFCLCRHCAYLALAAEVVVPYDASLKVISAATILPFPLHVPDWKLTLFRL